MLSVVLDSVFAEMLLIKNNSAFSGTGWQAQICNAQPSV